MSFLSDNLKALIAEKGLSQNQVADMIDEARTNFNNYVNGKRSLQEKKRTKMCELLGLNPNELLAWELNDKYPPDVIKIAFENSANRHRRSNGD